MKQLLERIQNIQTDEKARRLRTALFFIALTIELVIELLAKSACLYPYESYTFRLTFLLTLLVVLLTDYTPAQYAMIAAAAALGLVSYAVCGRNEILRFGFFIIACKGVDMKKAMKYAFYVTAAGAALIVLLAATGILGQMKLTANFRGYEETRYTFGMGHPNAFHCIVLMLMMLWLYLHREKQHITVYLILLILQAAVFLFSGSRTALIAGLFALTAFLLAGKYGRTRWFFVCMVTVFVLSILFSVWGATLWHGHVAVGDFAYRMDMLITGRFQGVFHADQNGMFWNWLPFSSPANDAYFDMGWVRLAYWYGYIPAFLIVVLILRLMIQCERAHDAAALAWITGAAVYTIIEAHLVSVYIGRNYLLLLAGMYWYLPRTKKEQI